jgi:hypothetical protein
MLKKIATQTVEKAGLLKDKTFTVLTHKPAGTPKVRAFIYGVDELPTEDRLNEEGEVYIRIPEIKEGITIAFYVEVEDKDVWADYKSVMYTGDDGQIKISK